MKSFRIQGYVAFSFATYITGILVFTLFRIILFISEYDRYISLPEERFSLILKSFVMGWRFDTVISAYLILLPFLLLALTKFINWHPKKFHRSLSILIGILYSTAFLVAAVDIPYFKQFFSRFTLAAFAWIDTPAFVIKMAFQEPMYWIVLIPFIALCVFFWKRLTRYRKKWLDNEKTKFRFSLPALLWFLPTAFLLLLGARGRLEQKSPIRIGTAYFSNHAFPNQLGLNPTYTLIKSIEEELKGTRKKIALMPDKEAITSAKKYLDISDQENYDSPIARKSTASIHRTQQPNLVLVIMESMTADKMGRYGNPDGLTPTLDSLAEISYSFDNTFSAGIHTHNGIFSTLYSYPALMQQHAMKHVVIPEYTGIANELKKHDYHTIYFTNHDDQFDNVGGFLSSNGFETIVSEKDYPDEKVLSTLGVGDDFLFEYAVPKLNQLHETGKPFFASLMTASDHGPYNIPDDVGFSGKHDDIQKRIVEYADWSIQKFLTLARKEAWYDNTIFVFIADHGNPHFSDYDMPLSYHHVPFIIHAPKLLDTPQAFDEMAGQIDVGPTLIPLMGLSNVNNTLGVDLMKHDRPYMYFSADDKYGCINKDYFLVVRNIGTESLYHYKNEDSKNYISEKPELADSMKHYAKSMIQSAQWLLLNKKTGDQE